MDNLKQNTANLQNILQTVNSLPTENIVDQATPVIEVSSDGLITATAIQESGKVEQGTKQSTYQLPTLGFKRYTPNTASQNIEKGVYLTGLQYIDGDPNLIPKNIKAGVSIFGVSGTCQSSDEMSVDLSATEGTCTFEISLTSLEGSDGQTIVVSTLIYEDGKLKPFFIEIGYGTTTINNILCDSYIYIRSTGDGICGYTGLDNIDHWRDYEGDDDYLIYDFVIRVPKTANTTYCISFEPMQW